MKNLYRYLPLPLGLFAIGLTATADWTLIDDFEDQDTSNWDGDSQLLQAGIHEEFQGAFNIVPDPIGGNDSHVGEFSGGPAEGDNFGLPGAVAHSIDLPNPIEREGYATIYFQLGINSFQSDNAFGVTHRPEWLQFWGDMETVMRYEFTNATFDVYNTSGFETFGFPELNLWYHVWKVLDLENMAYEVFIQGGRDYPEQTKVMTFEGNESFFMRNRAEDPLVRFGIIHNINSIEVPFPRDPMYLDNLFIDEEGENLTIPEGLELVAPEQWAGLNIDSFGYVNTDDFLGRLYVEEEKWVFVDDWDSWAYLPPENFNQFFGNWLFVPHQEGDLFNEYWISVGDGIYHIFGADSWAWVPEEASTEEGVWVFAMPPFFEF